MKEYQVVIQLNRQRVRYLPFKAEPENARATAIRRAETCIANPFGDANRGTGNFSGGFSATDIQSVYYHERIPSESARDGLGRYPGFYWGNTVRLQLKRITKVSYKTAPHIELS